MGCPTFWLLESLCEVMDLQPGMRVMDLGCGKAGGSIFLAKEYGLQVWAVDPWIKPTENWERIREAGVEEQVFPLNADGTKLPFAENFFDAVIADNFPDDEGYQTYLRWEGIIQYPEKLAEDDAGRNITFVRLVARRKSSEEWKP